MEENQILLTETNFSRLKDIIKKEKELNKDKEIIFTSNDDELNRKVIEKLNINLVFISQKSRKDFQKQRNSGFNQVIAKAMKKNNINLGINLDEIIEERNLKAKADILARVRQNIVTCNKNKIQMKFIVQNPINYRNKHDLKSLGLILGMPTWMISNF